MPRYDQERVVRLVSELRKALDRLRKLSKLKAIDFTGDPDKVGSAKYHFIVAIESCIDLCNHIIAQNGYRVPEDYGDTFTVMAEVGALEPSFAEELKEMAKFRNRLVHIYWQVDDSIVYDIMTTKLEDIKDFLNATATFLGWDDET